MKTQTHRSSNRKFQSGLIQRLCKTVPAHLAVGMSLFAAGIPAPAVAQTGSSCANPLTAPFNSSNYDLNTPLQNDLPNLSFYNGSMIFNASLSGSATWNDGIQVQNDATVGQVLFLQPTNAPDYLNTNNKATYEFTFPTPIADFTMRGSGLNNADGTTIIASYQGVSIPITAANFSNLDPVPDMVLLDTDGDTESDTVVGNSNQGGTSVNTNIYTLSIPGPVDKVTIISGKESTLTSTVTIGLHSFGYCLDPTLDFGDAPDTYGTDNVANNSSNGSDLVGATHTVTNGIHLGAIAPDAETNAVAPLDATGDGAQDDGVTLSSITQGSTISLPVQVTGNGALNAWIDWNGNGVFDAGEQIATNAVDGGTGDTDGSADGTITLSITAPANASSGTTYARFRFSSETDLGATGSATDGEVEDYALAIATAPINPDLDGNFCQVSTEMMFILDKSGSVSLSERQEQRDAVLAMLNYLVDNNITSRVGIVRFDTSSATVIDYTDVTAANLPTFENALNTNYVNIGGGNTNWEAGFQQAISLGVSPGSPDVVFFFADGNINSGGSPDDEALQFKQAGAHVYGIGIQNLDINDFLGVTDGSNTTQFNAALDNANSADYVEVNSYNNLADDMTSLFRSLCPPATNNPNVLLVKRITRINNLTENGSTALNVYVDDPSYEYDDNTLGSPAPTPLDTEYWPTPSTFLLGATNGGETRPGDEIEYTIYFLSAGTSTAIDVQFCDKVPSFQTFIPDTFNSVPPAPSGGVGANRGISVEYNGSILSYTNDADGDTAQYYPPGSTLPTACDNAPAQTEDNGAIVVNLGDLPQATGSGTPATSYGSVRFRAKVK